MLPVAIRLGAHVTEKIFLGRKKFIELKKAMGLSFIYGDYLINFTVPEHLKFLIGPNNQYAVNISAGVQAEMQSIVAGGLKSSGWHQLLELRAAPSIKDVCFCANAFCIQSFSFQLYSQIILAWQLVAQNQCRRV